MRQVLTGRLCSLWGLGALLFTLLAILGIEQLMTAGVYGPGPIIVLAAVAVLSALCVGLDAGLACACVSLFYGLRTLSDTGPSGVPDHDKTHAVGLLLGVAVAMLVLDTRRRRALARQREQTAEATAEAARLSEEHLHAALRAAPIAVFGQDCDLRYTWAQVATTGSSPELLGKRDDEICETPEQVRRLTALKQWVLETGATARQEIALHVNDRQRHFDLTVQPLRDGDGWIVGVTSAAVDLTGYKQVCEALHHTEERFRIAQDLSHRKVTAVLESITDGFYALDHDWRFTYINAQAERYLGCPREQLLGKIVWEARPVLNGTMVEEQFRQALATGTTIVFESGPPVSCGWLEVHAYPSSEGLSVYFRDITGRKQAEEALRENEAMLARAQQIGNMGSWEFHLGSGRILCSDQAYRILGLTPIQLQAGQDAVLACVHSQDQPHLVRALRRTFTDGAPCRVELRVLGPDACVRTILAQAERICDSDGRPVQLAGTILDITERKQIEQQLEALNETLEQRVAQRTAEAEQRTAQLRTLASELTLAEQRERRRLAQILHDHLQQLLVGAKFSVIALRNRSSDEALLGSLAQINDLVDQSIKVSRSLTVEISPPVLYDGGLAVALQWLGGWMQEKHGLTVTVEADEEADPEGEDLRVLLFQAVRELLFNIVKHADVRQACLRMERLEDDQIRIVVTDTGQGFDPAARSASGRYAGGLGLLSIRERLEILGGSLEIQSAPGKGTCAVLTAPLSPPTRSVDRPVPAVLLAGRAATALPPPPAGRIRVLLADDHKILREGLLRLLQLYPDIEVVGEAADGRIAVELARRTHPDVILMDVTMPNMNGIEATRCITAELPHVRIIGLSMHTEADMAQRMREAGAAAYLSKSSDPDAVIEAIRDASQTPDADPGAESAAVST